MKYLLFTLAFIAAGNSSASVQSGGIPDITQVTPPESETTYLVTHQAVDPRFMTSIERIGPCTVLGPPKDVIRVPWQIYPSQSMENHEEGTARIQLIFDADWCVRKATITQSTKYWRLDNVTLQFAMTIKSRPKLFQFIDGEPTLTFPITWRAGRGQNIVTR